MKLFDGLDYRIKLHCGKNFVNYFKYWQMNLWTVHQIGKMSQNIDMGLRKKFRFIFAKIMPEVQLQLQIICT